MSSLEPQKAVEHGGPDRAEVTFVGNATVLLRLGPFTLLTDPNFLAKDDRAYLGYGLWSKRLRDPAMGVDELPGLDAVVLSHLHGDHWDRVAEEGIRRDVPILTTTSAASTLSRRGFDAEGMHCWQTASLAKGDHRLTVTCVPGRHARGLLRKALPDVMGTVLDYEVVGRPRLRLYISGDTLCYPELAEIAERFPDIDVALPHLGGTRLLGVFLVTMDGEQGRDLMEMVQPDMALPIHHDDYSVFTSPVADFVASMQTSPAATEVVVLERGVPTTLPLRPRGSVEAED